MIGCAPSRFIQSFIEETNFPHEMYCDSQKIIHKAFEFNNYYTSAVGGTS